MACLVLILTRQKPQGNTLAEVANRIVSFVHAVMMVCCIAATMGWKDPFKRVGTVSSLMLSLVYRSVFALDYEMPWSLQETTPQQVCAMMHFAGPLQQAP